MRAIPVLALLLAALCAGLTSAAVRGVAPFGVFERINENKTRKKNELIKN